jgi:SPP1 gp7 family putative phage head morphogenesis protein
MRYEAGLRTEILAMITELGRDLVREMADAGLDTPRTDWQRARLRELLKAAQDRIQTGFTDIAQTHTEGMTGAAEASATGLTVALNDAVGFEMLQAIKWTPEQLAALVDGSMIQGAPSSAWWARQSVDLQNAFGDQMRQGMLRGEALGDLKGRVKDLMGVSTRNAESLVRTSAMAVNNAAQLATYQANADVIDRLQWCATLDRRSCVVCGSKDGQEWPLGSPHEMPPIHWSCRCVAVPITKTWEQLATRNKAMAAKLDGMEPGMRSSMGGPVSADTTWESWLGGQSDKVKAEVLGPARLKLWESGKL